MSRIDWTYFLNLPDPYRFKYGRYDFIGVLINDHHIKPNESVIRQYLTTRKTGDIPIDTKLE